MANAIDAKAGADGPSTTAVRDLLSGIVEVATHFAPAEAAAAGGAAPDAVGAVGGAEAGAGSLGRVAASRGAGGLPVRTHCAPSATPVANFFRRTEPHSPLSYTLDEAVRRGRMTWPELLAEVVADTDTRNTILNTLGIRPPPPEASE